MGGVKAIKVVSREEENVRPRNKQKNKKQKTQ